MFRSIHAALRRVQGEVARVLDAGQIAAICREAGYHFRRRILDPVTTIQLFIVQILNGNLAIGRLRDFSTRDFSDVAYCRARGRLPLKVLQILLQRVANAFRPTTDDYGRWHGHRTFHVDGSSFSMPDTPGLQRAFGQPGGQLPGCGFPVAHLLTLFHAGTGFLLKVLAAPLRTHDMSQVAHIHPELQEGDVLVADRGYCSYVHFALLLDRKLHGLFRAHQKLIVNFRLGRPCNGPGSGRRRAGLPNSCWLRRLGVGDQIVEHFKPTKCPDWMSEVDFAALPPSLTLRELRYRVERRGCRTRNVTLVTTLLDVHQYPAQDLAELYGQRWQVETNLRHLKQTMKMDVLHSKTEAGVLKELTVFALVYNLVRTVMHAAAVRQDVPVDRISFADALG
jgi:Transposase DDE domain